MGDWHLQPLDPACRQYKAFLLQGALGPETLKTVHGFEAEDILQLYSTLQHYTCGFHESMLAMTDKAQQREALLESIWQGHALLWLEALGVSALCWDGTC